ERLFTRRGTHNGNDPVIETRVHRDFTRGASLLSLMRANELLRDWLTCELKAASHDKPRIKLKWEGTQVDLIEVLKGMHLNGDFGDVPFQRVMDWATQEFGINTKNHDQVLQNMKGRYDTTAHLKDLLKVMNEDFIIPPRKK
ncbi:MAG TPA: RteC domain-containing protein, partial [Puia sp.]|nr:RteC domain-containing protein [Puia sp.]